MKRTAPASEIDPTGAFERAYAETAGVPVDAVQRKENAMTGKTDELLNCPFGCDGVIGHRVAKMGVSFACMECDAEGPFIEGNAEDDDIWAKARAAWNRRAPTAQGGA